MGDCEKQICSKFSTQDCRKIYYYKISNTYPKGAWFKCRNRRDERGEEGSCASKGAGAFGGRLVAANDLDFQNTMREALYQYFGSTYYGDVYYEHYFITTTDSDNCGLTLYLISAGDLKKALNGSESTPLPDVLKIAEMIKPPDDRVSTRAHFTDSDGTNFLAYKTPELREIIFGAQQPNLEIVKKIIGLGWNRLIEDTDKRAIDGHTAISVGGARKSRKRRRRKHRDKRKKTQKRKKSKRKYKKRR